jgi:predicted transposase/invertase (TIGR01784 family)
LFPHFNHYLSCHTTRETLTNKEYLSDIVYYFLELSKFDKKENELKNSIDKWSYFLKMAGELEEIPEALKEIPYKTAFETAMVSRMTKEEYELYDNAAMQITDHKGSLELAHKEGREEGIFSGRQEAVVKMLKKKFKDLSINHEEKIKKINSLEKLDEILLSILDVNSLEEIEKMI